MSIPPLWPSRHGMQELFSSSPCNVSDDSFSQAIWEVGIYPAVGELLLLLWAVDDECIVGKVATVGRVVFNGDKMVGGKLFKSLLCIDSFITAGVCHHVYTTKVEEVLNKDGGCLVALNG